jgi:hypothetical protein
VRATGCCLRLCGVGVLSGKALPSSPLPFSFSGVVVQVVPTDYQRKQKTQSTFQYAATEHYRHLSTLSSNGMPGVYFYYEVRGRSFDAWLLR